MHINAVRARIAAGLPVLNAWLSIASSYVAEAVAHQGVDSITIDLQHGAIDYTAAFHMLQAIATSPAAPLVRVPPGDFALMSKLLDSGACGVICPMVNSAAEARAFTAACRYPPAGTRSFGPNRVSFHAGPDYWRHANDHILLLAQVETRAAVAATSEIITVDGLDGVYIGPADLSLSFAQPPSMAPAERDVRAAIADVRDIARAAGRIAAIHTDGAETARQRFQEGFQICSLPTDMRLLINAVKAAVEAVRR